MKNDLKLKVGSVHWAFYEIGMDIEIAWEVSNMLWKTLVAITIWNGLQNYHRQQQLMSLKGSKHFVPEFSLQKIIHFGGECLLKYIRAIVERKISILQLKMEKL